MQTARVQRAEVTEGVLHTHLAEVIIITITIIIIITIIITINVIIFITTSRATSKLQRTLALSYLSSPLFLYSS